MEWKIKTRARLLVPETPHKQKKKYVTKKISKGGMSVINVQAAILPPGTIAQTIFLLVNKISCFIGDLTTH